MKSQLIPLDAITIVEGRRALQPAKAEELAESFKQIGHKTPISVLKSIRTKRDGSRVTLYILVAGLHRYHAAKLLKWTHIEATLEEDEQTARIWEIHENLKRAELSASERGAQTRKLRELMEAETEAEEAASADPAGSAGRDKPGRGSNPKQKRRSKALAKTAEALGKSVSAVKKDIALADLHPEAEAEARRLLIVGKGDKSRDTLLAITRAGKTLESQLAKVREIEKAKRAEAEERRKEIEKRNAVNGPSITMNPIREAWMHANPALRRAFVAHFRDKIETILKEIDSIAGMADYEGNKQKERERAKTLKAERAMRGVEEDEDSNTSLYTARAAFLLRASACREAAVYQYPPDKDVVEAARATNRKWAAFAKELEQRISERKAVRS